MQPRYPELVLMHFLMPDRFLLNADVELSDVKQRVA
jgi:hypothetical protein